MSASLPFTDPIFIAGFGRSGTNWLLNLLDLHPTTHCRNEPDAFAMSPFKRLPVHERAVQVESDFAPLWDAALQWASLRYGDRDRMPRQRKSYLRAHTAQLRAWRLLEKQRLRKLLSITSPALRAPEWSIPWWLDARDALARARHVLKLNDHHDWYAWVMAHRPASRVVHLVRHPGGVLESWRKRWLARNDAALVRRGCIKRLERIGAQSPEWAARFGDLERLSTAAAELWYWRYSTEHMCRHGQAHANYKRVLYEELVADPARELRAVYAFCGLTWNAAIAGAVEPQADPARRARWYERVPVDPRAADKWRERASAEDLQLIEQVLSGSPMQSFWPERGSGAAGST